MLAHRRMAGERRAVDEVGTAVVVARDYKRRTALIAHFDEIRPAATVILAGLADPRMKIEVTAVAGDKA